MFRWLKRVWEFVTNPPVWNGEARRIKEEEDKEDLPDLRGYSLYEIGKYMCRTYEDGIGSYTNATHFGEYSMNTVLSRYCANEIRPFHFDELDRLLQESVSREQAEYFDPAEGMPVESKVKKFRRVFFDQFTPDQIKQGLAELREREEDAFGLQSIVQEQTTDGYVYEWHTPQSMDAHTSMDETFDDVQTFESETVDMQHLGAQFNLVDSQVTKHVAELVAKDADILWSQLDPHIEVPDYDGPIDGIAYLEVVDDIREAYFDPNTIVSGEHTYIPDRIAAMEMDIEQDATDTLPNTVTSVIADSTSVGFRVTRNEWEVRQPAELADPYRYVMTWTGNYAITQPDAVEAV